MRGITEGERAAGSRKPKTNTKIFTTEDTHSTASLCSVAQGKLRPTEERHRKLNRQKTNARAAVFLLLCSSVVLPCVTLYPLW